MVVMVGYNLIAELKDRLESNLVEGLVSSNLGGLFVYQVAPLFQTGLLLPKPFFYGRLSEWFNESGC